MANINNSAFKSALAYQSGPLTSALAIIASQKALQAVVKTALPTDLAEHVQHCVQSGKRVLVYTEAASWAAQIRFFNEAIVNKIKASTTLQINSIQVRLLPQFEQHTPIKLKNLPSKENIDQICQMGVDNLNNDVLKASLSRLADTLSKK